MKYMVMECHPSYAVLLDENGYSARPRICITK